MAERNECVEVLAEPRLERRDVDPSLIVIAPAKVPEDGDVLHAITGEAAGVLDLVPCSLGSGRRVRLGERQEVVVVIVIVVGLGRVDRDWRTNPEPPR